MDMQQAIRRVTEQRDLTAPEMEAVMRTIMTGEATDAQIGGFLIGLRMKGETVEEIAAAARVMRELATGVDVAPERLVDTCGTGGDASGTFNISTTSAFVVAAAGGRVAKHGNRSVSSRSGSADVLEAAGVRLDLGPEEVARCIEEVGVGFMFAPNHHGAMRHAIGPRREMGTRTLFNLLGPLTNPASAPHQLIGVFAPEWVAPMAHVLGRLGSRHVMVVHAADGMDEISLAGPTRVAELREGEVREYEVEPAAFGLKPQPVERIRVGGTDEALAALRGVLAGEPGPAADIVALNAGAAIYVTGLADSLAGGIEQARDLIRSGQSAARLDALVELTRSLAQRGGPA